MTEKPRPSSSSPPPSGRPSKGSRKDLVDAYKKVVETETEKRAAAKLASQLKRLPPWVKPVWVGVLVIAFVALGVTAPSWLLSPHRDVSRGVLEASLRVAMYDQGLRIQRFKAVRGRMPRTLEELGTPPKGITYESTDPSRYVLRGVSGPVRLVLTSDDTLKVFLGKSLDTLNQRRVAK